MYYPLSGNSFSIFYDVPSSAGKNCQYKLCILPEDAANFAGEVSDISILKV